MTGESVPVEKEVADHLPEDTPLGDRVNMLISGTLITVHSKIRASAGTWSPASRRITSPGTRAVFFSLD